MTLAHLSPTPQERAAVEEAARLERGVQHHLNYALRGLDADRRAALRRALDRAKLLVDLDDSEEAAAAYVGLEWLVGELGSQP